MEYCTIVEIYHAIIHIHCRESWIVLIYLCLILLHLRPQLRMLDANPSLCISTEVLLILVILVLQLPLVPFVRPRILNLSLHLLPRFATRVHACHLEYLLLIKVLLQSLDVLLSQNQFAFFVQRLNKI